MAGLAKQTSAGNWRAWYRAWDGRRQFFTGSRDRAATLREAEFREQHAARVRRGELPRPEPAQVHRSMAYAAAVAEYLEGGAANGGLRRGPWGAGHLSERKRLLTWWGEALRLHRLADIENILPRVERALREKAKADASAPKTLKNRAEALHAFCRWCHKRQYLAADPLAGMTSYAARPKTARRALTRSELDDFLEACLPAHRLVYTVAAFGGLRANEIRSLVASDVNSDLRGVHLHGEWTKNRMDGFQPLPDWLVHDLVEHARGKRPDARILLVAEDSGRMMAADMKRAGIRKWTPEGKVDFHALRTTYSTMLDAAGATEKQTHALMRILTEGLAYAHYTKARPEDIRAVVDRLPVPRSCALHVHLAAAGGGRAASVDSGAGYGGSLAERPGFGPGEEL